MNRYKGDDDKEEVDIMATLSKPCNHAFVLSEKKAASFLRQDNSQLKSAMARVKKFKKNVSHSITDK